MCGRIWWSQTSQNGNMAIWQYGNFACWITRATDTHSGYEISFTVARQQWLSARLCMLRYTYFSCLVNVKEDEMKPHVAHIGEVRNTHINPYPANVENMVSSLQCQIMADGI
jgi:hypothetical protein